jgi:hypothetical protein
MKRLDAELLVRDGENVILRADIAAGQQIITTRLAQAGDGLKVSIEGQDLPPRGANNKAGQNEEAEAGDTQIGEQKKGKRPKRAKPNSTLTDKNSSQTLVPNSPRVRRN